MKPIHAGQWSKSALRSLLTAAVASSVPLAAQQTPPSALFVVNPDPAHGEERITVQFLDRSTGDITAWNWDFGDGTSSRLQNPLHTFLFGNFDVTLTVTGPGGQDSFTREEAVEVSAIPPTALSTMAVPLPSALGEFVRDMDRAVELGKALFWDVQVGSDGLTACATCHHQAGTDSRSRNTLHPGADGVFSILHSGSGGGPNHRLNSGDFPFRKYLDPMDGEVLLADTDDRRGTAGVLRKEFVEVVPGARVDQGRDLDDELFQVDGVDTLQTTGRDAPTVIGAVFFHRLFWDGRANHFFNGRNIWGNADPSAPSVYEMAADGGLVETPVLLNNGALASQAIGPPLSEVEMSWAGRDWRELGRKLIAARPLANQQVSPDDSVLGPSALPGGPGLQSGLLYEDLVQAAFHERWWGSSELSPAGYTHMEENFSLFFGLAILCYEATLIPDESPFDRFRRGQRDALGEPELRGMSLFMGRGRCITCHGSPLFGGAPTAEVIHNSPSEGEGLLERMFMFGTITAGSLELATTPSGSQLPLTVDPFAGLVALIDRNGQVLAGAYLPASDPCAVPAEIVYGIPPTPFMPDGAGFQGTLTLRGGVGCELTVRADFEWNQLGPPSDYYWFALGGQLFQLLMPPASGQAVYDDGFYNIGVRDEREDLGVGGEGAFGPLSITRRVQAGEDVGQHTGFTRVEPGERVAVDGAFKTPTLRNVELTGPYMHNGGMASLEQVVEFYSRGGDFTETNIRNKDVDVSGFQLTEEDKADLVAFLEALTDPRVRHEQAPFDHPALPLRTGHRGSHESVRSDADGNALAEVFVLPATGSSGGPALVPFEQRLPASVSVFLLRDDADGAEVAFLCDKKPRGEITVRLALSDPSVASLSVERVVFDETSWRLGRVVRILPEVPVPPGGLPVTLRTSRVVLTGSTGEDGFEGVPVADVALDFVPDLPAQVDPAPRRPLRPHRFGTAVVKEVRQ